MRQILFALFVALFCVTAVETNGHALAQTRRQLFDAGWQFTDRKSVV